MNGWNEDNYLEELVLLLGRRAAPEPCPESEALRTAGKEGAPQEILRGATVAHVAQCPSCNDLQRRLYAFDDPMPIEQPTEWEKTERRLDSWLERFLESRVAVDQPGSQAKESDFGRWWKRPATWQTRWALVSATAIALVIGSFVAGRLSAPQSGRSTSEATSHGRPGSAPEAAVADTRRPARRREPESQSAQAASQNQPLVRGGTAIASRATGRTRPSPVPAAAPPEGTGAADTPGLSRSAPSNSQTAQSSPPPVPRPDKAVESAATPSPSAPGARETAQVIRPAATASDGSEPRRTPSAGLTMPSAAKPVMVSRGGPVASAAIPHHSITPLGPRTIQLGAGTRVWITLKAVLPRADGVSEFRGVVLLPVTQSGAVLFGRDTEVAGTVTVRNGKRLVKILEFVSAGSHYRLGSASGDADLRVLGDGEAVEFDSGRVLETWMVSVSTYERVPAGPAR